MILLLTGDTLPFIIVTMITSSFAKENLHRAIHISLVGIPMGALIGAAIAGYDYIVNAVMWEKFTAFLPPQLLCLLPFFGMIITGSIIRIFQVDSPSMADEIVHAYHHSKPGLKYHQALPKTLASIATMGFGCSAGMEGASKWVGGMIAGASQSRFNRWPKAKALHGKVNTTMLAGAAAGISAIFRAPLTGAIMGVESPYRKDLAHDALIHALVASATSYVTFTLLRNNNPYFPISFQYKLDVRDLLFCIPVGVLAGLLSQVFLRCLIKLKNTSIRIHGIHFLAKYVLGGVLLSAIAYGVFIVIGTPATLQAGLPTANLLLAGQYAAGACLVILVGKLAATAVTFGMGGVGGLFVPSATIGAAMGALCDIYLAPSQPGLFTLVGIAAFTGASYNSLLFSAVFIAEASGNPSLVVPGLIASSFAYLISAGISNSPSQKDER